MIEIKLVKNSNLKKVEICLFCFDPFPLKRIAARVYIDDQDTDWNACEDCVDGGPKRIGLLISGKNEQWMEGGIICPSLEEWEQLDAAEKEELIE
ncbi:MAG: hypothetical protein H6Q46_450 [Deltaproteobacteria bacterium]|nr:hypothetical protein [Deltaproteobacteria bacterium]